MKVTVLLAIYNGERYVSDAVDDTLAQTFGDFELLVVDDASTDGTADILAAYTDPRIRVMRNETNMGQAPSLNRGLADARGEYIARIDADDRMLPTRLERQVAVLDAEPEVALVGTWIDVVDENDRAWSKIRGDIRDFVGLVVAILIDRYPFGHPSLMYRRNVVLELGGYDSSLAPAEDKDLYRRLALARREVRVVREPLVRYRRHEGQLSQAQRARQLAVDHEGQERFLTCLAPGADAGRLRALLETGIGPPDLVDSVLSGAAAALRLTTVERLELERAVVRTLAFRAARAGSPGRPFLRWATAKQPALLMLIPIAHLAPVRVRVRAAAESPRLRRIRDVARRSKWLRRVYAHLE